MRKVWFFLITILILTFFVSCGEKKKILAVYDNTKFSLKDFQNYLKIQDTPPKSYKQKVETLSNLIVRRAVLKEARKQGYYEMPDLVTTIEKKKKDLIRKTFIEQLTKKAYKIKFKKSDLKKFLSNIKMKYIWINAPNSFDEESWRKKEKLAKEVYAKIKADKNNFSYYADLYTEDPHNFKNGFAGYFTKDQIPQEWKSTVLSMKEDTISKPLSLSKGYAILRLNQIKKNKNKKFWFISQIFLKGTSQSNKEKINQLYEGLKQNNSQNFFGEQANLYSQDGNNKKGGDFRPFNYDSIYPPLAESAYKTSAGKISSLIYNKFGIFILKIERITKPKKDKIQKLLKNKKQLDVYKKRVVQAKQVIYSDQQIYRFQKKLHKSLDVVKDYSVFTNTQFSNKNYILFKFVFNNKTFTYKDFLDIAKKMRRSLSSMPTYMDRVSFFERYLVEPEALYIAAIKKGWAKNPLVTKPLKKITDNLVYDRFMQDNIEDFHVDVSDLQKYYTDNFALYKNKKFKNSIPVVEANYKKQNRSSIKKEILNGLLKKQNVKFYPHWLLTRKEQKIQNLFQSAEKAKQDNKNELAEKLYRKIIKKDASQIKAYISLYALYVDNKDNKAALDVLSDLRKIKDADVKELFSYLDSPKYNVVVANLLGEFNDRTAIYPLMKKLNTTNQSLLAASIKSLGNLHAIVASEKILDILKMARENSISLSNNYVAWYAVEALGKIGDDKVNSYFLKWARTAKNVNVKCFLIEALGNLGKQQSVPVLKKLLDDPVWGVRVLASQSLKKLTKKDYPVKNDVLKNPSEGKQNDKK